MTSPITFSGLASGIDSTSIIKSILDQQRSVKITPLQTRITQYQDENSSLDKLRTLLQALSDKVGKLRTVNGGAIQKQATSSDETVASGTANSSAANGTYSIAVSQLAKNATYSFKSTSAYTDSNATIAGTINNGDPSANRTVSVTIGTGANQETTNVVLTSSTTLTDFVNSFNSASSKGVASTVNVGTSASPDYRIVINSADSGTADGQLSVSVGSSVTGANAFNSNTVSQATDATFTISGVSGTITRGSNSISDVLTGVTVNLQQTGSAVLSVSGDSGKTSSVVQDFVSAYNEVVNYVKTNDSVTRDESGTEPTNVYGPLAHTSVDNSLISSLQNALFGASTSGNAVNTLSDLGITTQQDGTLAFNADAFNAAVASDATGSNTVLTNLGESLGAVGGTIQQFTQFQGLLDKTISNNNDTITKLNTQISDAESQISQQQALLTSQYAGLESLVGKLNSQQNALTSALPK